MTEFEDQCAAGECPFCSDSHPRHAEVVAYMDGIFGCAAGRPQGNPRGGEPQDRPADSSDEGA